MRLNSLILGQEEIEQVYRLEGVSLNPWVNKMTLNTNLNMNFKLEIFKQAFELLEHDLFNDWFQWVI